MGLSQASPVVFEDHEPDTPGQGRIELGIVEPAVHMHIGLVIQSPLRPLCRSHIDGDKIDGQRRRNRKKTDAPSRLRAARKLVHEDQPRKNHDPAKDLPNCPSVINLKNHTLSLSLFSVYFYFLNIKFIPL